MPQILTTAEVEARQREHSNPISRLIEQLKRIAPETHARAAELMDQAAQVYLEAIEPATACELLGLPLMREKLAECMQSLHEHRHLWPRTWAYAEQHITPHIEE